jgi:hypothetical protein
MRSSSATAIRSSTELRTAGDLDLLPRDAWFAPIALGATWLKHGIASIETERAAETPLAFRCWRSGSNPVSFEMM